MRFGIGPYESGRCDGQSPEEAYEEMLEQAALAEEVGFDSVWIGERHFAGDESCSSCETVAAAVAARTRAARVGVIVAAGLTHPLYLAEDFAVLDNIANGRALIALRANLTRDELAAYRIAAEDVSARFDEALEIVRKAWAPAEFAHQGRFWKVPAADFNGNPFANGIVRINVTPKPAQLSVPVWIAGGESAAVERAARLGLTWLASPFDTIAELHRKRQAYAQVAAAQGRPMEEAPFAAIREVHVGETQAEARAAVEQPLLGLYAAYRKLGLVSGESSFEDLARDRFIIGDVDHVIEEIGRYRDQAGVNYLVCRMAFAGMRHGDVMATMRFFGQAVIPEFRMAAFPAEIRRRTRA